MFIHLTKVKIDPNEALAVVRHPSCGAVASFEGNIRQENDGRKVFGLEYEVYEILFHAEVQRIFAAAKNQLKIQEFALIQRVGKLDVGETGIFITVSSPHRHDAIKACAFIIEQFKKRAPVWKKEFYAEDERWVACTHLEEGK